MVCHIPEDWEFPEVIFSEFQSKPENQAKKRTSNYSYSYTNR